MFRPKIASIAVQKIAVDSHKCVASTSDPTSIGTNNIFRIGSTSDPITFRTNNISRASLAVETMNRSCNVYQASIYRHLSKFSIPSPLF